MPPLHRMPDSDHRFILYLQFISDTLGGDVFPLKQETNDIHRLVCERAIDYSLIKKITAEIRKRNAVFQANDVLEAYSTLDALGSVRANLLDNQGDIHQISLVDRIGELTVRFFNLTHSQNKTDASTPLESVAPVYPINTKR